MMFDAKQYLQQKSWADMKLGLERIEALLAGLHHPERNYKIVHIAGTNGKGSTSAFIASIVQEAKFKVGLYTSPYVIDFNERIRVDGVNISDNALLQVVLKIKNVADTLPDTPSSFELLTAVALQYFSDESCDIVVLETGLGGRFDATNAVIPAISAITPIALDHVAILGDTIEQIAAEKAGIIKPEVPLVLYPQEQAAHDVIIAAAQSNNAPVCIPDFSLLTIHREIEARVTIGYKGIQAALQLVGSYQPYNACMAIEIAKELIKLGVHISDKAIVRGLEKTLWPGRFQVVSYNPPIVVDGGHNEQGALALAQSLQDAFPGKPVHAVVGVLADKDWHTMMDIMAPHMRRAYCIPVPDAERALSAHDLASYLQETCAVYAKTYETYEPALKDAIDNARADGGVVCCFGSLYLLAQIFEALASLGVMS